MLDIRRFESMVKLTLTEQERTKAQDNLSQLTRDFTGLEDIDTSQTIPLVTVLDIKNVMKEDAVSKFAPREALLANAPQEHDGYFQVPKTLA